MLGFATVDRQPSAEVTAVWLTTRLGPTLVRNTNAVVIRHDDPDHDKKVWSLTADRSVVLTEDTDPPLSFTYDNPAGVFDELIEQTAAHQERICEAVEDYSRRKRVKLVTPTFMPVPVLSPPKEDKPPYRALAVANFVGRAWAAWLFTEEQRHR